MAQAMQQMGDYTIDVDNKVSNANKNLDDFSNKGSKVGNTLKETASKTSEFASGMTEVSKGAEAVNKVLLLQHLKWVDLKMYYLI